MTDTQENILRPYFDTTIIKLKIARVDDPAKGIGVPPDYSFLQKQNGQIEYLPVVIFMDPRLNVLRR